MPSGPLRTHSDGFSSFSIGFVRSHSHLRVAHYPWIIPAEIFDTKTRSKGVSIGAMTSFAFNTLIGQVTDPTINNIGWRYFLVFVVCNFTNAIFSWALMPETKKRPFEEKNNLFSNSPWFVPTMNGKAYETHDLENRAAEISGKQDVVVAQEVVKMEAA